MSVSLIRIGTITSFILTLLYIVCSNCLSCQNAKRPIVAFTFRHEGKKKKKEKKSKKEKKKKEKKKKRQRRDSSSSDSDDHRKRFQYCFYSFGKG